MPKENVFFFKFPNLAFFFFFLGVQNVVKIQQLLHVMCRGHVWSGLIVLMRKFEREKKKNQRRKGSGQKMVGADLVRQLRAYFFERPNPNYSH